MCGMLTQAGRSVESLLEELAAAGLAEGPPSARLSDYRGGALRDAEAATPSPQLPATAPVAVAAMPAVPGAEARPPLDPAVYPPPSAAGLRQALTALCVLPLTSAVVHSRHAPAAQCTASRTVAHPATNDRQVFNLLCHVHGRQSPRMQEATGAGPLR